MEETSTTATETVEASTTPDVQPEPAATETVDVEAIKAQLAQARNEAIAERKRRQEAEGRVSEFEQASLSEKEKAEAKAAEALKRAEAAEAATRALEIEVAVKTAATTKNFVDAEVAYRLLDTTALDTAGNLGSQVEEALAALAKAKPFLVKSQSDPTNGATRSGATLTAEDYARMTPEQIAEQTDEQRRTMLEVLSHH